VKGQEKEGRKVEGREGREWEGKGREAEN